MTMSLVVKHFDDLLSTPEDVEQLNRAILDLAVRGKLTHREAGDESAKELLKRVSQEKEKLGKDKSLPPVKESEKPFDLPAEWEWARLQSISEIITKGSSPKWQGVEYVNKGEGILFITSKNVGQFSLITDEETYVEDKFNEIEPRSILKKNDILMNIVGASIGRSAIYNLDTVANINQAVCLIRLASHDLLDKEFFILFFNSSTCIGYMFDKQVENARANLSMGNIANFAIPVPPLAEQQRIVARVEELFAQTRALAKELAHSQIELDSLNKSALSQLLASETPEEFNQHWDFIAGHFDLLFQTPEHVAPLRQSILELAVRGKLTRREAGDESAGKLLKRINKEKPLPPIEENERPFDLPEGWEWVRLENIVSVLGDGLHGTPEYADNGDYFFVNGNNLSDGEIEIKKNTKRVSQSEYDKYKKELNSRTVFVSINGTIGNLAFYNNEKIILGKSACYFNLLDEVDKFYIGILIRSPYFLDYVRMVASRTTISNVSLKSMRQLMIPLPPLAEQERIVKRVEQLLSLCDALEARLQSAEEERGRLVAAVMSTVGG